MAVVPWTKNWTSSDDGSALGGADLKNIQDNVDTYYQLIITRLSTTAAVSMNTAAVTTLYTVPSGKTAIITHVVIRTISATLGTSYGFTGWVQGVNLSSLTAVTDFYIITSGTTKYTMPAASSVFALTVTTGTATTATIDVFGYLF